MRAAVTCLAEEALHLSPVSVAETAEPFDAFMRRALYDPERGYYSRRIRDVGREGDFATSATLSPLLARAVACWLQQARRESLGVRDVIEVGAGSGELMGEVARRLGWWRRRGLRWHVVETSPVLWEKQQAALRFLRPRWWGSLEEALAAAGGTAWIYHNELLDAFPCRLFERDEEGWREVWVRSAVGGVTGEELREAALPDWASALQGWPPGHSLPAPRQRVEVHESVREWLAAWTPGWRAGAMLCLDYGDEFPSLYHRRPGGTLRGYFMRQRMAGPALYQNVGRQDLTADINFTDYRTWAAELGLCEVFFGTQRDWIQSLELQAESETDTRLLDPDGAGGAFKVVIHRR